MAVTLVQSHYRIRTDSTAAQGGTPVWAAALDTPAPIAIGTSFRIRVSVSSTGTTANTSNPFQIYCSRNGGAYAAITTSGTYIKSIDATAGASADNSAITTSLIGGTGTFQNVGQYDSTGASSNIQITAGDFVEFEFGLQITTSANPGDSFQLEVYFNGGALNTYTVIGLTTAYLSTNELCVNAPSSSIQTLTVPANWDNTKSTAYDFSLSALLHSANPVNLSAGNPAYYYLPSSGTGWFNDLNQLVQSNGFSTTWTKNALTLTSAAATAPDSTTTAWSFVPTTAASTTHYVLQNTPTRLAQQATWTLSAYVKAMASPYDAGLVLADTSGANGAQAYYSQSSGVYSTSWNGTWGTGYTINGYGVVSIGSGWYRIWMTVTTPSANTQEEVEIATGSGGVFSYTANGTNGIYIWGAQVTFGSYLKPYTATTTSALYSLSDSSVSSFLLATPSAYTAAATSSSFAASLSGVTKKIGINNSRVSLTGSPSGLTPKSARLQTLTRALVTASPSSANIFAGIKAPVSSSSLAASISSMTAKSSRQASLTRAGYSGSPGGIAIGRGEPLTPQSFANQTSSVTPRVGKRIAAQLAAFSAINSTSTAKSSRQQVLTKVVFSETTGSIVIDRSTPIARVSFTESVSSAVAQRSIVESPVSHSLAPSGTTARASRSQTLTRAAFVEVPSASFIGRGEPLASEAVGYSPSGAVVNRREMLARSAAAWNLSGLSPLVHRVIQQTTAGFSSTAESATVTVVHGGTVLNLQTVPFAAAESGLTATSAHSPVLGSAVLVDSFSALLMGRGERLSQVAFSGAPSGARLGRVQHASTSQVLLAPSAAAADRSRMAALGTEVALSSQSNITTSRASRAATAAFSYSPKSVEINYGLIPTSIVHASSTSSLSARSARKISQSSVSAAGGISNLAVTIALGTHGVSYSSSGSNLSALASRGLNLTPVQASAQPSMLRADRHFFTGTAEFSEHVNDASPTWIAHLQTEEIAFYPSFMDLGVHRFGGAWIYPHQFYWQISLSAEQTVSRSPASMSSQVAIARTITFTVYRQ